VPLSVPDIPDEVLDPRGTWQDKAAYDTQARKLAAMFADNFTAFANGVPASVRGAGPRVTDAGDPDLPIADPGEG